MPSIGEALGTPQTAMSGSLHAGVEEISLNQVISFNAYSRVVLPLDGYVFWVRVGLLGPRNESSLFNALEFNAVAFDDPQTPGEPAPGSFQVKGSLHYSTEALQIEENSSTRNRVVFTAEHPVQNLNDIDPNILYIATFDGPEPGDAAAPAGTSAIRFSFSSRSSYYQQAGLWHYIGNAVFSSMETQIIDDLSLLNSRPLIVSNSLPAWLAFNVYDPPWPVPVARPNIKFYPSFLVPENLAPPYGVVHIEPAGTEAWQTMPRLGVRTDQHQLARDRVQITLYGCNNDVAQSLLYSLLQYSYDTEVFGILNIPAVRDEKEPQVELHTLAQKKRMTFEVSYNQSDIRDVARQLIESCTPTVQVGDEIVTP